MNEQTKSRRSYRQAFNASMIDIVNSGALTGRRMWVQDRAQGFWSTIILLL